MKRWVMRADMLISMGSARAGVNAHGYAYPSPCSDGSKGQSTIGAP
jgi:hypothetical protein